MSPSAGSGVGTPTDAPTPPAPVTVAVTRRVAPEDEALMAAWAQAGTSLAERFPGFLGTGAVRSASGSDRWHMLYRFASAEDLARWDASPERDWWLSSASGIVEDTRVEHRTGIEGWFDEPHDRRVTDLDAPPPAPPRWKQMVVIFCAFFPTSLALFYLLGPLTHGWFPPLRVLLTCCLAIPWMTYVFLPFITRLFQPWLQRS